MKKRKIWVILVNMVLFLIGLVMIFQDTPWTISIGALLILSAAVLLCTRFDTNGSWKS